MGYETRTHTANLPRSTGGYPPVDRRLFPVTLVGVASILLAPLATLAQQVNGT